MLALYVAAWPVKLVEPVHIVFSCRTATDSHIHSQVSAVLDDVIHRLSFCV